jgi:uncharacterized protein (TIRG00374 family)
MQTAEPIGTGVPYFKGSITRVIGAAVVSGVALWLAARNVHADGLRSALARATFLWLLPYPVVCIALNVIRGEIWRLLLRQRVSSAQAFWAYTVGFVVNNALPFRAGEAARVLVLSRRSQLPIVEVAAAAGLERLLDLAVLSLMLLALGPSVIRIPGLASGGVFVAVLVAGALGVIAMLARLREHLPAAIAAATGWLSPSARQEAVERTRDLTRGLTVLLRPAVGIPAAAGALVVWVLTVLLQWLVLRSFQPDAGVTDAAFMVAAVSLASALPAAPGFVGVYHWAGQQSLVSAFPQLYDASTALAAATVAHAVSYVTSTVLGVIGLWYFGIPPSAVGRIRDGDRNELPPENTLGREADSPAGIPTYE